MAAIVNAGCNVTTRICHHSIYYMNRVSEDRQEIHTWLPLQSSRMKSLSLMTIFSEVCFQSKARSIIKETACSSITLLVTSRQIRVPSETNSIRQPIVPRPFSFTYCEFLSFGRKDKDLSERYFLLNLSSWI